MALPYTGAAKRGIIIVALIVASSTELLAQGTSPWLQAIDVLQQAFTGPIARGLSLIAIVVGGFNVCLWRGRQQEGAGRDRLRAWHGNGSGQLPGLAVLMEQR